MATITPVNRKKGEAYLIRFVHPKTKKFVRRVVYCSKKEAEQIRKKIDADIALGKFGIESGGKSGYYWSQLKKRYLQYSRNNKSDKSTERDRDVLKAFSKYLQDADLPLTEISSITIEKFKESELEKGKKPATVGLELRHLRAVFSKALEWEMVDCNPVVGVKHPDKDIVKVRFLTKTEIRCLLDVIDANGDYEFKNLVLAYLHTGARRNELLADRLPWSSIDFENRMILLHGKGQRKRYIPLNDTLESIFEKLRKEGRDVPFDFKPNTVTQKIAKYYRKAGIKGANLHSLRKTFGSILLQDRLADLYTVSRLLGHTTVTTTEKYYVDLLDDNYRASVGGLDKALDF